MMLTLAMFAAHAADHAEAPLIAVDPAADIADAYAWHDGNHLNLILTFAGGGLPGQDAVYEDGVRYTVYFDADNDQVPDHAIHAQFGQNGAGQWGIRVMDLPGAGGPVIGGVETLLSQSGTKVWAGLRDDPFFFDAEGLGITLGTGDLSFDNTRDSFAGTNVTAIAMRTRLSSLPFDGPFQVWATASRTN